MFSDFVFPAPISHLSFQNWVIFKLDSKYLRVKKTDTGICFSSVITESLEFNFNYQQNKLAFHLLLKHNPSIITRITLHRGRDSLGCLVYCRIHSLEHCLAAEKHSIDSYINICYNTERGTKTQDSQIHHAETTNTPSDFITADVIKSWWDYSGKTVGI